MFSGIYEIRNTKTGGFYIGSASNLRSRRRQHFEALGAGRHHNTHLQNSFRKHGRDAFVFKTLFLCDPEMLLLFEQRAIDIMRPSYNKRLIADSNRGIRRSERAKENIRRAHMGIRPKLTQEHRDALRERMIGNTYARLIVYAPELREKKRLAMLGKNVGKSPSENCRKAVSIANKSRVVSKETRERMSKSQKASWARRRAHGE